MTKLPSLDSEDHELLIRYSIGGDESVVEAIVTAFDLLDVDTTETDTVIHDVVDSDALVQIHQSSSGNVRVSFRMWDHPVVVESGHVMIYESRTTE